MICEKLLWLYLLLKYLKQITPYSYYMRQWKWNFLQTNLYIKIIRKRRPLTKCWGTAVSERSFLWNSCCSKDKYNVSFTYARHLYVLDSIGDIVRSLIQAEMFRMLYDVLLTTILDLCSVYFEDKFENFTKLLSCPGVFYFQSFIYTTRLWFWNYYHQTYSIY